MPNRGRILLVEDHADTRAALFEMLTHNGYSVITADNGQQALDLLERGIRPALILLDLAMPHVSGAELIEYLRYEPELRHTPTIVVTGLPRDQIRVIADVIFPKPVDFPPLLAAIDRLVARVH